MRDDRFVSIIIADVMRSFDADVDASIAVLKPLITPESLEAHGYNDAPPIARGLPNAHAVAPEFVREVYQAIFAFEERSDAKVDMTGSRIFGFTSNRRQDFNHAKWQLGQDYSSFLQANAAQASYAMASVLNAFGARHVSTNKEHIRVAVELWGATFEYEQDLSRIWDSSGLNEHEPERVIIAAWFKELPRLWREAKDLFNEVFEIAATHSEYAIFWRHLLRAGVEDAPGFGLTLAPLLTQTSFIEAYDSTDLCGAMISSLWPHLDESIRESIVDAIAAVTFEPNRYRLLGCIPASDRDPRIVAMLPCEEEIPENDIFEIESSVAPFSRADYLREQGVDVETVANRAAQRAAREIEDFNLTLKTQEVTPRLLASAFGVLRRAVDVLEADGVDFEQASFGWSAAAETCDFIARMPVLKANDAKKLCAILYKIITLPSAESDSHFDEQGSWGGPEPHYAATIATLNLARQRWTPEVQALMRKASAQAFRPARAQIASGLGVLYRNARATMWRLARQYALRDESTGVVSHLLHAMPSLLGADYKRAAGLIDAIYNRISSNVPGGAGVLKTCRDLYIDRAMINDSDKVAADVVEQMISARNLTDAFRQICFRLRIHLTECVNTFDVSSSRYRCTLALYRRLVSSVAKDREDLDAIPDADAEAETERIRAVFKNQTELASEFRYAVHRENEGTTRSFRSNALEDESSGKRRAVQREIVGALLPALLQLSRGASPATAHALLEGLEPYVDDMPDAIFPVIASIVRGAKGVGLGQEYMAAEIVVRIIEKYLTRYPEVIEASDERRRELVECLESFATWPSAMKLVYRFDEVFR